MMGIESDIHCQSNSRVIDFDTVIRKFLIKQERILNNVNRPVASLKKELLTCGWVKVVPREKIWWLDGECFIGLEDGRPWVLLSFLKWTKSQNTGQSGSILDTWQPYLCLNRFFKFRLNTFIQTTTN